MARRPKACASFPHTGQAAVSLRNALGSAITLISALRRLFDMARLAERGLERDGHANKLAANWLGPSEWISPLVPRELARAPPASGPSHPPDAIPLRVA